MSTRSHLRAALAASALLLASIAALPACIEEDKTACKDDGDCRGVRECRDGTCVTPEGLRDGATSSTPDAGGADADDSADASTP